MTPSFRYPTHELLLVTQSPEEIATVRAALQDWGDGPSIALTVLTHPECLLPHLQAEDSTCPDLILLDLQAASEAATIRAVKEHDSLHEIPVIVMVDRLNNRECLDAYDSRANCCLERPASAEERKQVIELLVKYWFGLVCLPSRSRRNTPRYAGLVKIVVTNDDGYDAAGLAALRELASQFGEVTVVAPATPQSYMGHRVTTVDPIEVAQAGEREFHVSGTPADCARIALRCLVPDADWLWSGINHGGNLGVDVYISGTVAAGPEAALLGYRALALSHYRARGREINWALAQRRLRPVVVDLLKRENEPGRYWNINLPHPPDEAPEPGIAFCDLDRAPLDVAYRQEGGRYYYAGTYQKRPFAETTDVAHCFGGAITVTGLQL